MKLIIDAMGGDNAPKAPVEAAVRAVNELDIDIILVGNTEVLEPELSAYSYDKSKISVVHCEDVISNYDEPVKSVKNRKDASVVVAANLLKDGGGDAMLSMGSTGALLAAGLLIVGRIKGISRPALATVLPTYESVVLLMDAGANTVCRSDNLLQFAVMGSIYMKNVMGRKDPKVGLVSNGEEECKGNELVREAYTLLKESSVNFYGNIEGRDINMGVVDVAVCDGFVGNVVLKTVEGVGLVVNMMLKDMFLKNIRTKMSAVLVKDGLRTLKKRMDYTEYGGAPLLGTKKPVIKGHGSSDAKAVFSAIKQSKKFVETNVIDDIQKSLTEDEK